MTATHGVYIALLEGVDGVGETVDNAVPIGVDRRTIFESCSEVRIGLIPTGIYLCVGLATFRRIYDLRELKRLEDSKGRKEPRKLKGKKLTEEYKRKSKNRREHAKSMKLRRSIVG